MKKIFFSMVILLNIAFFEVKATDCPDSFLGPFTLEFPICQTCHWVVEWCCLTNGTNGVGQIHINSVYIRNDNPMVPCTCIQTIQTTNGIRPVIPWEAIFKEIIESGVGCYVRRPNVPPCEEATTSFVKFSNGGCYEYVYNLETGFMGWTTCGTIPQLEYCYNQYKICYEIIDGQYFLKLEAVQPPMPLFECDNGCERICQ